MKPNALHAGYASRNHEVDWAVVKVLGVGGVTSDNSAVVLKFPKNFEGKGGWGEVGLRLRFSKMRLSNCICMETVLHFKETGPTSHTEKG